MTKSEIRESLFIMKHYADGKARQEEQQIDNVMDYHTGCADAYKDMRERIDSLIERM